MCICTCMCMMYLVVGDPCHDVTVRSHNNLVRMIPSLPCYVWGSPEVASFYNELLYHWVSLCSPILLLSVHTHVFEHSCMCSAIWRPEDNLGLGCSLTPSTRTLTSLELIKESHWLALSCLPTQPKLVLQLHGQHKGFLLQGTRDQIYFLSLAT